MAKRAQYSLAVNVLQDDQGCIMGWWSKGHHDSQAFVRAAQQETNADNRLRFDGRVPEPIFVPTQSVRQLWWRCVPAHDSWGYSGYRYYPAAPYSRGAFAVTVSEHHPVAGWDGCTPRSGKCFCPACRDKSQHYYDEQNRLRERLERVRQWRSAARPEDYRHDVVIHRGEDNLYPCLYLTWADLRDELFVKQIKALGVRVPVEPAQELAEDSALGELLDAAHLL